MAQYTFRFQFMSCAPERAGEAEQVSVSARHTHAAWLARRFPPRVARGFRSSRIFRQARARRRMPGIAERAKRTDYCPDFDSASSGCRFLGCLWPAERTRERDKQP